MKMKKKRHRVRRVKRWDWRMHQMIADGCVSWHTGGLDEYVIRLHTRDPCTREANTVDDLIAIFDAATKENRIGARPHDVLVHILPKYCTIERHGRIIGYMRHRRGYRYHSLGRELARQIATMWQTEDQCSARAQGNEAIAANQPRRKSQGGRPRKEECY